MLHEIKILKPYADAIIDGRKTFEVRRNDRGYNAGDQVKFIPMESSIRMNHHEIERHVYDITYVHSGLGMQPDYVVFGIKESEI